MEWLSLIFVFFAAIVAVFLVHYSINKCFKCNKKVESKKYLLLDPATGIRLRVCVNCFYDSIVTSKPEEKSAN